MDLDRRKSEFADDVGVLDRERFFDSLALDPLGRTRGPGDSGAATERLEAGFLDHLRFRIDAHLQFHDVTTFRPADHASPDVGIFFWKASDVAGIVVVIL